MCPEKAAKVDAEGGDVDRHVRHGLAGVEHGERADPLRGCDQHVDRVDGAEHVRLMGEGNHFRPSVDQLIDVGQVQPEVVGDLEPAQGGPGPAAEFLPRQQIRVVLHLGDDDLVTGTEPEPLRGRIIRVGRIAQRIRNQVDRLGGVLGEDHLVGARRADERSDPLTGRLVEVGCLLGKLVRTRDGRRRCAR